MPRIKMLEKMSAYQVTFLADKPGEAGVKSYTKKVFAGNENDAIIAFNGWFDSCKAFPEGSSCDIQKVELIQSEGATYDEYVAAVAASLEDDFEYSPITALEFARDDFKDITKAFYSATKTPKEAAKEIDAKYMGGNESRKKAEGHEGWDGWEEVEGLEDSIEGIENLAYELRHCIRGAKTHCKDWKALSLYIKGLASNLDDAAELMAYKTDDDESANEAEEPVGELFDALKQALAGKGYKVSQFTSDKEFVGQEKPYNGISIENEDPNAYHKNPYRIVLDTDNNLFRIFFPGVRRKSVTGQPGSISGIVKFILRDLNLDESKKKNPSKDFSSTVEEGEDGKKKSH